MKKILLCVLLLIPLTGCGWLGKAAAVAEHEVDPQVLLDKYMWFKETRTALDKKAADITMYKVRAANLEKRYGADALKWPRDVRESQEQRDTELIGIRASYNSVAAKYNEKMAEINWSFCNAGTLPKGLDKDGEPFAVLPKSYAPYETN